MKWFAAGEGQTLLDPDEARGCRFDVNTRGELDELEQANILDGLRKGPALSVEQLLDPIGLCTFHRRLFGQVWTWAGELRRTEKNIGVAPWSIPVEVSKACSDARFWLDESVYSPRESAVRYHHRLVRVHIFANGNGRHARLVADRLVSLRNAEPLRWPRDRMAYISALRHADARRFDALTQLLL